MEGIGGMPIGVVKLADVLRPALVLRSHPALGLNPADVCATYDPLDPH